MKRSIILAFVLATYIHNVYSQNINITKNVDDFFYNVRTEFHRDSNIYANSEELDDELSKLGLDATYLKVSGLLKLQTSANLEIGRYSAYDEDYEDFGLHLLAEYPNLKTENTFYHLDIGTYRESVAVSAVGERLESDISYANGIINLPVSNKFKLEASVGYMNNKTNSTGYSDVEYLFGDFRWIYVFSEKLDFFTGLRKRSVELNNIESIEFDDQTIRVGATGKFSDKLTGQVSLGHNQREEKGSNFKDLNGLFFSLSLFWSPSPKLNLEVTGGKDFDAIGSGISTDVLFLETILSYTISRSYHVELSAIVEDGEYHSQAGTSGSRNDEMVGFGAKFSYTMNCGISAFISGQLWDRSSNDSYFDYDRNTVAVGLNYEF